MALKRGLQRRSSLRILEEAVNLLRSAPFELLSTYYIGSIPFILGLFYFWADMSRNAFAHERLVTGALGMALLFAWMKAWQGFFAHHVWYHLQRSSPPAWTIRSVLRMTAAQTFIHATGFLVLPAALLVMLPFGWCYAFYQNVLVFCGPHCADDRAPLAQAWQQAKMWPRQNHLLLAVISVFAVVVFVNLAIAIISIPYLLKRFLGVETLFTMSGIHVLNTTFLITAWGCTHLCIDPIIKTAYVFRCHYGMSMKSGTDLKAELNRWIKKMIPALVLVLGVFWGCLPAECAEPASSPSPPVVSQRVSPEALDESIRQVLAQRKFSWRLPREMYPKDTQKPAGPLASIVNWIVESMQQVLETIFDWIGRVIDWLKALMPKPESAEQKSRTTSRFPVQTLLILLLAVCAVALVLFVLYAWQRRRTIVATPIAEVTPVAADLADETVKADELPMNQWLEMAKENLDNGQLRLAFRAVYLAILAFLAEGGFITIEVYKSNREYERELQRRAHDKKALLDDFAKSVSLFEKAWYGWHAVSKTDVIRYMSLQERMQNVAQP